MTRITTFILLTLAQAIAHGESILVPSPDIMLRESNFIATGSLQRNQAGWELIVEETLKGAQKRGDRVRLESQFSPMSFSFDGLSRLVGNDLFLFVGRFDETAHVARPSYGNCSAWPQGTMEVLLPERTLADTVSFAKKSLGVVVPDADSSNANTIQRDSAPNDAPSKDKESAKAPLLATKAPLDRNAAQAASRVPPPVEAPASSTRWSVVTVVMVAVLGLLWLCLKKRK